jgi:quercetin dioxygenase-like cupin family protein
MMSRLTMNASIGRHLEKAFDLEAFPRSKGHPELQRGQMRYIGAGGSPKVDDPNTLPPEHFSLSIIDLPPGHYGAMHYHDDCEETFLGLDGRMTVGVGWGDEVIELSLGPKDLLKLPPNLPHAYRNDTLEPARISIKVGSKRPNLPIYTAHPNQSDRAIQFGAAPGKTCAFSSRSEDPRQRLIVEHLARYAQLPVRWDTAGFAWKVFVGEGGVPAGNFRESLAFLPPGTGVRPYVRDVEDAYFVLDGALTVGWVVDGRAMEERLGPRDVILTPPGVAHYFRNDGYADVEFMMVVGNGLPEDVKFERAQ